MNIHKPKNSNHKPNHEHGQGIVEYLLLITLVGVAVIVILNVFEPALEDFFARFVGEAELAPPSLAGYTPPPTATASNTPDPNASPTPSMTPSTTPTNTIAPTATNTPEQTSTPTATETPAFAACEFEEVGGRVVVEAEHYTAQGTSGGDIWVETASFSGYAGTSAMEAIPNDGTNTGLNTSGPQLDYRVRISNPGTYYVYVRGQAMSESGSGANDSIHVGLNDTAVTNNSGSGLTGYDDNGFEWQSQWDGNATSVTFDQPGTYTINIWMREDGIVIDRLWLTTDGNAISDGSTSAGPTESSAPAGCTASDPPPPTACYALTTSVSPADTGSITVDTAPNCASDPSLYTDGTDVTLDVAPANGYTFSEWSGDITSLNSSITINMDADYDITANFSPDASQQFTCNPTGTLYAQINFQGTDDSVPTGYLVDDGSAYGDRSNSFTYGWNTNIDDETRDRDSSSSPDQRFDTLIHTEGNRWEIEVPNGEYEACLVSGDPNHTDSYYHTLVEGSEAINFEPSSEDRWDDGQVSVTVEDGRLTLTDGASANNNKLNFIHIYQVSVAHSTILFVAGSNSLTTGESEIYNRLNADHNVTIIEDRNVSASSDDNVDLIFISYQASANSIGSTFLNSPVPIIVSEYQLYGDMNMAGGEGRDGSEQQMNIVGAGHPLAAGYSGMTQAGDSNGRFNYATDLGPDAVEIATIDDRSDRFTIFAYDTGSNLTSGTATARRVGFYFENDNASENAGTIGWELFDAAVTWALGN